MSDTKKGAKIFKTKCSPERLISHTGLLFNSIFFP